MRFLLSALIFALSCGCASADLPGSDFKPPLQPIFHDKISMVDFEVFFESINHTGNEWIFIVSKKQFMVGRYSLNGEPYEQISPGMKITVPDGNSLSVLTNSSEEIHLTGAPNTSDLDVFIKSGLITHTGIIESDKNGKPQIFHPVRL